MVLGGLRLMRADPGTLRIIQVSDCHVAASRQADYRSQNADLNLDCVVQAARLWKPTLLLVTGDVSEDGSRNSYQRTSELLGSVGVPVLALPGNHDDPKVMCDYFPNGPWDGPYCFEQSSWQLTLLDSTMPGQISGSFSGQALSRLEEVLQASQSPHHLIALHHQPVAVGAPWIDRYALDAPQAFFRVTDDVAAVRCIAWGHIHHDFRGRRKGVSLLGSPSSVANSLPASERFTLDPQGPACRWLELSPDGRVETGILFAGNV